MDYQYIPFVVEKSLAGERSYDIYSRLLEERIIFLTGPINDAVANTIIAQLLYLQSTDSKKDVFMYINSPGGSAYSGLAIYDTIQHLKNDVSTIVVGTAASAASMILSSGTKGKRLSLPHSLIHIHQPLGGAEGQASDIEISAREILRLKDLYAQLIAKHSGKKIPQVVKDIDRDYYMTPQQAKEYGMIDRVIESTERK
ncbi:MAG: ATP-dependent Clp protease proteolytic subunit [Patescibacteria group bacterium]|nr:ATP-dependent Clp protease proteolytic subunit [Patescibacteria group bacterium]